MPRTAKDRLHRLEGKRARRRYRASRRTRGEVAKRRLEWERRKAAGVQQFDEFFKAIRESNQRSRAATVKMRERRQKQRVKSSRHYAKPVVKPRTVREADGPGRVKGRGRQRMRDAIRRALPVKTG